MTTQNTRAVEIDTAFIKELPYLDEHLSIATKRTIDRVTKWIRGEIVKSLSTELNLKISTSKRRFRAYSKGKRAKLWLGLDGLNLHYFGIPVQDDTGVSLNGDHHKSAFIDPMRSSDLLVWRRTGKKRLPIEPVKKDITAQAKQLLTQYTPRISKKFREIFDEEIEHAITRLL